MTVAGCGNIRHSVVKNQISDVTSRTYATALHGIITSSFPGSFPNFVEYCTGNEAKHAVQSRVLLCTCMMYVLCIPSHPPTEKLNHPL